MNLFESTKGIYHPPEIYTLVILKYGITSVKEFEECKWIDHVPVCVVRAAVERANIIFVYKLCDSELVHSVKLRLGLEDYRELHKHIVDCLVEYHMMIG